MTLIIDVADPRWNGLGDLEQLANEACQAVAGQPDDRELSLLFTNDAEIAKLNAQWRGKTGPTNVLSFPTATTLTLPPGEPAPLGDIVLSYETVVKEAAETGKSVEHHTSHLIVHGMLHLLGYDHETEADAEIMEDKERVILARLGIADPYQI